MSGISTTAVMFENSSIKGLSLSIPISIIGLAPYLFAKIKTIFFATDHTPFRFLIFLATFNGFSSLLISVLFYDGALEDTSNYIPSMKSKKEVDADVQTVSPGAKSSSSPQVIKTPRSEFEGLLKPKSADLFKSYLVNSFSHAKNRISKSLPPQVSMFFKSPFCWVLFLAILCFSGPGIMFINNCGTLTKALLNNQAPSESTTKAYTMKDFEPVKNEIVANQALFSFFGRISSGLISDIITNYFKIPLVALLLGSVSLMYSAQSKISRIDSISDLKLVSSLVGLSMGSLFSLAPSYASELWGTKNFGVIYGIISIGPSIGAHICNSLFGSVWDSGLTITSNKLSSVADLINSETTTKVKCDLRCTTSIVDFNLQLLSISFVCFTLLLVFTLMKKR
ncbi:putative transporter MCH1 [Smittium culicis]|uniref:Putative transporter MCH1 n=1 Tax=Smittium culicis TaxID=133412 RepID=A0A1R1XN82_9FUNG|nr:putative transporter MCH1 [Smittium culicis]OMJ16086.1 putative transporter MCH1 [Smittium culicis]